MKYLRRTLPSHFTSPKKDRCDVCKARRVNNNADVLQQLEHGDHLKRKEEAANERAMDRERSKITKETAYTCFDLEITLT